MDDEIRMQHRDTQLHAIRDLMLLEARFGRWLTLGEIAELTEIGEASISAQLRHLRKSQHGRHVVEKRRRRARSIATAFEVDGKSVSDGHDLAERAAWEYRVLPPIHRVRKNTEEVSHAEAGA